ncbi:hypothetical protein [Actinoplanes sp. GCM10030250]|uniref:hypothetical protein n=1 Tax=Actinoplanes sp. GCM10030250 TaxID=3273376 RepID=UPI00360784E9
MSSTGPPPIRHHLVALPRHPDGGVTPLPCTVHRHLVAIPRPSIFLATDDLPPPRRDRRTPAAVILSACLLMLVCGGGFAGIATFIGDSADGLSQPGPAATSRLPARAGAVPVPSAAATPPATGLPSPEALPTSTATVKPIAPGAPEAARMGRRCTPAGSIGRTAEDLLVICGPDRYGRARWRPLSPAAFRMLTGQPLGTG